MSAHRHWRAAFAFAAIAVACLVNFGVHVERESWYALLDAAAALAWARLAGGRVADALEVNR